MIGKGATPNKPSKSVTDLRQEQPGAARTQWLPGPPSIWSESTTDTSTRLGLRNGGLGKARAQVSMGDLAGLGCRQAVLTPLNTTRSWRQVLIHSDRTDFQGLFGTTQTAPNSPWSLKT